MAANTSANARGSQRGSHKDQKSPCWSWQGASDLGALGGTRTPNLLIRSQMLYPLSYERWCVASLRHSGSTLDQSSFTLSPLPPYPGLRVARL